MAAVYDTKRLRIKASNFTSNTAHDNGGVFNIMATDDITITNGTRFTSNEAKTQRGGALHFSGGKSLMEDCFFEGNKAAQYGGALVASTFHWETGFDVTIRRSELVKNEARIGGGLYLEHYHTQDEASGVQVGCSHARIEDSTFKKNVAINGGGALSFVGIFLAGSGAASTVRSDGKWWGSFRLFAARSIFSNNRLSQRHQNGAAVHIVGQSVSTFLDSTFDANAGAAYGGDIATTYGSVRLLGSTKFTGSEVELQGKNVHIGYGGTLLIENTVQLGNSRAGSTAGTTSPSELSCHSGAVDLCGSSTSTPSKVASCADCVLSTSIQTMCLDVAGAVSPKVDTSVRPCADLIAEIDHSSDSSETFCPSKSSNMSKPALPTPSANNCTCDASTSTLPAASDHFAPSAALSDRSPSPVTHVGHTPSSAAAALIVRSPSPEKVVVSPSPNPSLPVPVPVPLPGPNLKSPSGSETPTPTRADSARTDISIAAASGKKCEEEYPWWLLYTLGATASVELIGLCVCAYYLSNSASGTKAEGVVKKKKKTRQGKDVEMQRLTQHMSNPMRESGAAKTKDDTSAENASNERAAAAATAATAAATKTITLWKTHQTEDGHSFYEDPVTGRTTWTNHQPSECMISK